jgi:predicted Na+-dependent transporter
VQNILVGLALVASMPVAGSSTAWSQNTDGDMALSLGLVLLTTLLSPLTTPAALHAVGRRVCTPRVARQASGSRSPTFQGALAPSHAAARKFEKLGAGTLR